jgi:hypothetical protein
MTVCASVDILKSLLDLEGGLGRGGASRHLSADLGAVGLLVRLNQSVISAKNNNNSSSNNSSSNSSSSSCSAPSACRVAVIQTVFTELATMSDACAGGGAAATVRYGGSLWMALVWLLGDVACSSSGSGSSSDSSSKSSSSSSSISSDRGCSGGPEWAALSDRLTGPARPALGQHAVHALLSGGPCSPRPPARLLACAWDRVLARREIAHSPSFAPSPAPSTAPGSPRGIEAGSDASPLEPFLLLARAAGAATPAHVGRGLGGAASSSRSSALCGGGGGLLERVVVAACDVLLRLLCVGDESESDSISGGGDGGGGASASASLSGVVMSFMQRQKEWATAAKGCVPDGGSDAAASAGVMDLRERFTSTLETFAEVLSHSAYGAVRQCLLPLLCRHLLDASPASAAEIEADTGTAMGTGAGAEAGTGTGTGAVTGTETGTETGAEAGAISADELLRHHSGLGRGGGGKVVLTLLATLVVFRHKSSIVRDLPFWTRLALEGTNAKHAVVRRCAMLCLSVLVPLQPLGQMQGVESDSSSSSSSASVPSVEDWSEAEAALRSQTQTHTQTEPHTQTQTQTQTRVHTLRGYQWAGVQWVCRLWRSGFGGGILADEMGLGKTIQAISAVFVRRVDKSFKTRPSLVVCPPSLVRHWLAEVERAVGDPRLLRGVSLDSLLAAGAGAGAGGGPSRGPGADSLAGGLASLDGAALLVVSYSHVRQHSAALSRVEFEVIVLDEAHCIKNAASALARALFALDGKRRLALSGTPVQNEVEDLWSIMNFILPGFLGMLGYMFVSI